MSYPSRDAALDLLACLQAFGEQGGNPVLALLGPERQLVVDRKYPQPPLSFGAGRWRAYYHHHDGQPLAPGEHGHFHVFMRAPGPDNGRSWAHLAGLGMDAMGQPLRWFAVNGWVTDDAWLSRAWLRARLAELVPDPGDALLPAWLCAMLGLYLDELDALLDARDRALDAAADGRAPEAVRTDRQLYQLAERPIHLQARLEAALTAPPQAGRQ